MSVTILRDNAPALAALLERAAAGAVRESCEAIKADAEAASPVLTGSLKASFYASVFGQESGYGAAVADAEGKDPKVKVFEEVRPEAVGQGVVSAAAGHDVFVELGTIHMAPRPLLLPAADAERGRLPARVGKAIAGATRL